MIIQGWTMVILLCLVADSLAYAATPIQAEPSKTENGGIDPGKWVLGMRAGFAPLTRSLTSHSSTEVGSLVNVQTMYSLNKWLLAGLMLEWGRHAVDQVRPDLDLGHQDTVSVLGPLNSGPSNMDRSCHTLIWDSA